MGTSKGQNFVITRLEIAGVDKKVQFTPCQFDLWMSSGKVIVNAGCLGGTASCLHNFVEADVEGQTHPEQAS